MLSPELKAKLAQAQAVVHEANRALDVSDKKHNYYSPKNAAFVKPIVDAWLKGGQHAVHLDCTHIGVSPLTLKAKMRLGVSWLAENEPDLEARRGYAALFLGLQLKIDYNTLICRRIITGDDVLERIRMNPEMVLRQSLDNWANNPALRFREKWPDSGPHKLTEADIAWFTDKAAKLRASFIVGIVRPDELQFVKVSEEFMKEMEGGA